MHGLAAVTLSLGVAKILTGRRYDLLHAWYALKSRTKGSIAFAIPRIGTMLVRGLTETCGCHESR